MEKNKRETRNKVVTVGIVAAAAAVLVILSRTGVFGTLSGVLKPILYGVILAYILWPVIEILEGFLGKKIRSRKLIRGISLIVTLLLFIALITLIIIGIIPQLGDSINMFQSKLSGYLEAIQALINKLPESNLEFLSNYQEDLSEFITNAVSWIWGGVSGLLSGTTDYILGVFSEMKNLFFALFLSIYFIVYKEKLFAQIKKLTIALFPEKVFEAAHHYIDLIDRSFGGFIKGEILDSLIIGIICALCMLILRIPYVLLISIVIGVTNLIPVIGPIIGCIPCAVILLIAQPNKTLIFIIMIIILQQFDGNLIKPAILAGLTSLNALWIMVAVTVMSGLMGLFGMFLGVPVFAVIYDIVKEVAEKRLTEKELSTATVDYYTDASAIAVTGSGNEDETVKKARADARRTWFSKVLQKLMSLLASAAVALKKGFGKIKDWLGEKAQARAQKNADEEDDVDPEEDTREPGPLGRRVRPGRSEKYKNKD